MSELEADPHRTPLEAMAAPAVYRETQLPPPWLLALLGATALGCAAGWLASRATMAAEAPEMTWVWDLLWVSCLAVPALIFAFLGRLELLVRGGALVVRFGFVPWQVRAIPLDAIERADPVTYSPLGEFGGWGLRRGTHAGATTVVYSIRGSEGVLLALREPIRACFTRTDRVLIGSGSPALLAGTLGRRASLRD